MITAQRALFLLGSLIAAPAMAQTSGPEFVPFTIDQQTYKDIFSYLGDVPSKYANPLMGTFEKKERDAIAQKLRDEADKKKK